MIAYTPPGFHVSPCDQVSFVVRHRVRESCTVEYEDWLRRIMERAAGFPGHLGVQVARPPEGGLEYVIVVRFASEREARSWGESPDRRDLVDTVRGCLEGDDEVEIHSGIDFWFTPEAPGQRHPVRWKQWLVTTSVIWPLTLVVPPALDPLFHSLPLVGQWGVSHGIVAAIIVALVIYLIMPPYVKFLAGWLFR